MTNLKTLLTLILSLSANHVMAVTWYSHCYSFICPEGQEMVKPNDKMVGTVEGTHKCYDSANNIYSDVIKTINYTQCNSKPCGELDLCQAYLAGEQHGQEECLQTIYSLPDQL